jgi:hypothetical protein
MPGGSPKLAKQLVKLMYRHQWQPMEFRGNGYVLEVRPYHAKLEAGFTLWRTGPDSQLRPVVSGHTENGYLLTAEGFVLDLPPALEQAVAQLLAQKPVRAAAHSA